jgi:hypothetical protein
MAILAGLPFSFHLDGKMIPVMAGGPDVFLCFVMLKIHLDINLSAKA